LNESLIKEKIGEIIDSDLNKSLAELNSVKKIILTDKAVQVYVELIGPYHWIYTRIKSQIKKVLSELLPDKTHEIFITEKPYNLTNRPTLKNVKNIIAIASGKGGVGKSSIASNIAAGLSLSGAKVGIIDGDVYGPSQPTMFGIAEGRLNAVQLPDGRVIAEPLERHGVKVASMGFVINRDEAAIVRGPMLAGYFSMLFEQVEWGDLDFLVFDLPPGTGDIQLTLTQKIPLTGAAIVTTPQEISLADVRRSITMFNRVKVDILGVIENMSYFVPPDMPDKKYYIFGEGGGEKIAQEFGVNLLGKVPLDISMREGNDGGKPIVLDRNNSPQAQILQEITENLVMRVRQINHDKSDFSLPQITL
jgi:ATP-binding protein involved in chromosome partitioning